MGNIKRSIRFRSSILLLILALCSSMFPVGAAYSVPAATSIQVQVNKTPLNFDVAPMIKNGRTLVPLGTIFEAMGATVEWDSVKQTVTARRSGTTVVLTIGSLHPTVNGKDWPLDQPACVVNGRALAPVGFVGEAFGGKVNWDAVKQVVSIDVAQASSDVPASVMVSGDYINLRSGPSTSYDKIGTAPHGQSLEVLSKQGDWYQVRYLGQPVWLAGWLVTGSASSAPQQSPAVQPPLNNKPQDHDKEVSLEYVCDSQGIRLIMSCGSLPNAIISDTGSTVAYRYPGFSIKESKTYKSETSMGDVSITAGNRGQDMVVQISLPQGLEHQRSTGDNGKKQVFSIPNSVTGVERHAFGKSGERLAVHTLLPVICTDSQDGGTISIKLADTSLNPTRTRYSYDSPTLRSLTFNSGPSEAGASSSTIIRLQTKEQEKYLVCQGDKGKTLYVLMINPKDVPAPHTLVLLDPGHGGKETGTHGQKLVEKDVNLAITLKVGALLSQRGIQVDYTRRDDSYMGLEERPALANLLNAALLVSIHNNYFADQSVNGTETFYYAPHEMPQLYNQKADRQRLAVLIQDKLVKSLGLPDRGAKQDNLCVLREASMPGALAEIAFLSNPDGERFLQQDSFQNLAAAAVAGAVAEYLKTAR